MSRTKAIVREILITTSVVAGAFGYMLGYQESPYIACVAIIIIVLITV